MKVILSGQSESKSPEYFLKASRALGIDVLFYDIEAFSMNETGAFPVDAAGAFPFENNGAFSVDNTEMLPCSAPTEGKLKIDPPKYRDSDLSNLNSLVNEYMGFLNAFAQNKKLCFLNHPDSIIDTLDKRKCKNILTQNGIAVTPVIDEELCDINSLRQYIREKRTFNLFIKPQYGSGAAGVAAYRYNPATGDELIYTSLHEADGKFINTKKISKVTQRERIELLVNFILSQPHIIEKWIPKPKYQNLCYDLRVVYQFGKIDFIVARCSDSPITNLHLNNNALDVDLLRLPQPVIYRIESLCKEAMGCFKGLSYAGIDILLSGKNQEPVIIEMNAQGDLIYQDIFNENKIYKNQVIRMSHNG